MRVCKERAQQPLPRYAQNRQLILIYDVMSNVRRIWALSIRLSRPTCILRSICTRCVNFAKVRLNPQVSFTQPKFARMMLHQSMLTWSSLKGGWILGWIELTISIKLSRRKLNILIWMKKKIVNPHVFIECQCLHCVRCVRGTEDVLSGSKFDPLQFAKCVKQTNRVGFFTALVDSYSTV